MELFTDQESSSVDEDKETSTDEEKRVYLGTNKGREIDQIPLCANCMAEVDIDQLDERSVVQKGLRRMDQTDGGMSRRRWEGSRWGKEKASGSKEAMPGHQRSSHQKGIQHDSQSRSNYGDGADSESVTENDVRQQDMGYPSRVEPSTIYVSMFDPIGRPAFRPSPTKPIPQWMDVMPNTASGCLGDDERPNRVSRCRLSQPYLHAAEVTSCRANDRHGSDERLNTASKADPTAPASTQGDLITPRAHDHFGSIQRPNIGSSSSTLPLPTRGDLIPPCVNDYLGSDERLNIDSLPRYVPQPGVVNFHSASDTSSWDQRTGPVVGQHVGQQLLARPSGHRAGSSRSSYASTICPTKSKLRAHIPTRAASPAHSASSNGSTTYDTRPVIYKGRSYVVDEPLTLPSSLMTSLEPEDNLSISTYSTYATPPEYPSPPGSGGGRTPDSFSEAHESHYVPSRPLDIRKASYASTSSRARKQDTPQELERPPRMRHSITHLHTRIPTHNATRAASSMTSNERLERHLGGQAPSRTMSHREPPTSRYRNTASSSFSHRRPPRDFASAALRKNPRAEPTIALTSDQVGSTSTGNGNSRDQLMVSDGGQEGSSFAGSVQGSSRKANTIGGSSYNTSKRRSVHSELKRLFGR